MYQPASTKATVPKTTPHNQNTRHARMRYTVEELDVVDLALRYSLCAAVTEGSGGLWISTSPRPPRPAVQPTEYGGGCSYLGGGADVVGSGELGNIGAGLTQTINTHSTVRTATQQVAWWLGRRTCD